MIRSSGGDRRASFADDMGRRCSASVRLDRLDIADDMVGGAISPGPAAGIFEHREIFAGEQLGNRLQLGVGALADRVAMRAAAADQGRA